MNILSPEQAAQELGITAGTVRQYCEQGRLGRKWGRVWLITREEFDQFKAERRPPGRPRKKEKPPS
jgi:excisionase family DNA binding protein